MGAAAVLYRSTVASLWPASQPAIGFRCRRKKGPADCIEIPADINPHILLHVSVCTAENAEGERELDPIRTCVAIAPQYMYQAVGRAGGIYEIKPKGSHMLEKRKEKNTQVEGKLDVRKSRQKTTNR